MRRILQAGVGVCLVSFLCGAWTPPVLFQALPTGVVAHWPFDDAAGPGKANVAAYDGAQMNGAAAGAGPVADASLLPPPFGGLANPSSLKLDGNDWLKLASPLNLTQKQGTWTVAAWVRPTDITGTRRVLSISVTATAATTEVRTALALVDGKIRGTGQAADTEDPKSKDSSGVQAAVNRWDHIAMIVRLGSDSITLYKNGAEVASTGTTAFTATATPDTGAFNSAVGAGADGAGNRFVGNIDDLRVYHKALTVAEIRALAAPRVPTQTAPTPGPESITINWTANQPGTAVGYNVYRREVGATGPFVKLNATPVLGISYTDSPPVPQVVQYEYYVRSVQIDYPNLESIDSNTMAAAGNPPAPRTGGDNGEGLFEDKCACGSSIPAPTLPAALAGLAVSALALRRRRSL